MIRTVKQTRVKTVPRTGFKRDLSFHLRLMHKTRKNFRTPKIAISLLGEQELQDSGLKRAKAVAVKRNGQSQRQAPAFREVQVTGTNSRKGMHQDFILMVMPKCRPG